MRNIKKQQEWCADQVDNPSQNWDNLCQSFARQSYGMGAYGSSAKVAWGNVKARAVTLGALWAIARLTRMITSVKE